jgi:hypothetical protein
MSCDNNIKELPEVISCRPMVDKDVYYLNIMLGDGDFNFLNKEGNIVYINMTSSRFYKEIFGDGMFSRTSFKEKVRMSKEVGIFRLNNLIDSW